MPKIKAEIVETPPEPTEGKTYEIISAKIIKTQRSSWDGVRVGLKDDKDNDAATVLWLRDRTTTNSKLGTFLNLLGNDTDQWLHKRITIVKWTARSRQIALAPPKK